jgi:protein ImuB
VPLFPLAARLRSEPELQDDAVAVLAGNGTAARVVAATRAARRAGVRSGMTLPQARARCPKLVARAADADCERSAQEALLEVADAFSPRIEDAGPGLVFLEADGFAYHFGTFDHASRQSRGPSAAPPGSAPPQNAEAEAARALAAAAEAASLPAWVGIAGSKLAARVAAEQGTPPTVVAPGEVASFLAPLPLDRLAPEIGLERTLESWGIHSVGDLARLDAAQVTSRLGETGRHLHAAARGLDPRPLEPRQPAPEITEGMDLEWPLVSLEPFLFAARAACERLCRRLADRGQGCARLTISLRLEPAGHDDRKIDLPAPTKDARGLLGLVRLELEKRPPGAAIAGFTFTAHPREPHRSQMSLLGPESLEPDRLATTIARLFALLGPERVGSPRPKDEHGPETFCLVPYAPPPPPRVRPEPCRGRGLLAVRVLRPPVALEVTLEREGSPKEPGEPDESTRRPVTVAPAPGDDSRRPRLGGRVRVAAGPWHLEESWWREEPVERDYWDVELDDGGLYRIYRERRNGDWFADGIYD